jgi:hypothetical protein
MMFRLSILRLNTILARPTLAFSALAAEEPAATSVFFRFAFWLALLPPSFAYLGTVFFGWRLGVEPLILPRLVIAAISVTYLGMLLLGFFSTALITRWMASTYGADHSLGRTFGLISIVGAPLAVGSIAHLYPHAFLNVVVLVPTLIWSMYLLYRGLPIVLKTPPEQGMLMSSALIAYLLVAWVSLLGATVALWGAGLGPTLGT